jgi:hypothetical protein
MMRLITAVKAYLRRRRSMDNKWTYYDEFMKINFPHVVENRDKYYH